MEQEIKLLTDINSLLYIISKQDSLSITYDAVSLKIAGRFKTRKETMVMKDHFLVSSSAFSRFIAYFNIHKHR